MRADSLAGVSIVLGVPLTHSDFVSRAVESDWLGKFWDREAEPVESTRMLNGFWEREYVPTVVKPIQEVIEVAESGGAKVYYCADLRLFSEASRDKSVVILVAHWKGSEVVADDVLSVQDLSAFQGRAEKADSRLAKWFVSEWESARRMERQTLVRTLNAWLDLREPAGDKLSVQLLEHETTRQAQRRGELDDLFCGLLKPGDRLELFDGMHDKTVVEAALATEFCGVLDLTVCSSTVVADYIASVRKQGIRTVQFSQTVDLSWAAKCVAGTLTLYGEGGFGYQEARSMVGALIDEVTNEAASRRRLRA